ncbi:DNA helicase [Sarracenia purpurea var. burkii]
MIVWQPELDINTEVQKRGRINRTGQILPPIYDYLCSAIPAEKRLVMMLKSKLKSLDANTTSSQKTSKDLIQSEDFLNKYGDKVVFRYIMDDLKENEENSLLERLNLGQYFKKKNTSRNENEDGQLTVFEDCAKAVSGRVALLNTVEQESFYNNIVRDYQTYIEYIISMDEYDLEMELPKESRKSKNSYENEVSSLQSWFDSLKNKTEQQEEKLTEKLREAEYDKTEDIRFTKSGLGAMKRTYSEIVSFFKSERIVTVPLSEDLSVLGVVLGIRKNDQAQELSSYQLDIAIANGIKRKSYKLVGKEFSELSGMMALSRFVPQGDVYEKWKAAISSTSKDRVSAMIVTGNILQAFGNSTYSSGRLIDFTMKDGTLQKGLLLSSFAFKEIAKKGLNSLSIRVPLDVAVGLIKSSKEVRTNINLTFFNLNDGKFKLITSLSRSEGGDIYTNKEILKLVEGENFNSVSQMMVGMIKEENLEELCKILTQNHSASIEVSSSEFSKIKAQLIPPKPAVKASEDKVALLKLKIKILKLKAQALNL